MADIDSKLAELKEKAWRLASLCQEEGDTEAFRALVDFTERIANLLRGRQRGGSISSVAAGLIDIFSPGGRYSGRSAKLDLSRYKGPGSDCVLMGGDYVSLSKAAKSITHYETRGPEWWEWENSEGNRRPVSELLKKGRI